MMIKKMRHKEKYHRCKYCKEENTYRIYIRGRYVGQKERRLIAIAWYCLDCKMFESDEARYNAFEKTYRIKWNMKPEEDFEERRKREVAMLERMLRYG